MTTKIPQKRDGIVSRMLVPVPDFEGQNIDKASYSTYKEDFCFLHSVHHDPA
jgi:hypothetical protein